MIDGTLIMESLRAGTDLKGLKLTVRQTLTARYDWLL